MFKLKIDKSGWEKLKKNLLKADTHEIQLGWFEENKYGPSNDNLQMAQVAQWNNEGHVNDNGTITPPRPFMTVGLAGAIKVGANKDNFEDMIRAVVKGQSVLQAMTKATTSFEHTLRKVMLDWDTPPNAPLTIELKGFDDPLVNSSELIANVTAKVEKKGVN
jgi:hypothetical protein